MTDLADLLAKARAAIGDHDPILAAGDRCNCLGCRTGRLAARGWPTAVVGDGTGSRSTTTSTPVERAALGWSEFADLSDRLNLHLPKLQAELAAIIAIAAVVDSRGSDDDVVPAGTGHCACGCGTKCDPRKNPANRLRSNLAPRCYSRWRRWRAAYPGVTMSDYLDACYKDRGESRAKPVAPAAEPRTA